MAKSSHENVVAIFVAKSSHEKIVAIFVARRSHDPHRVKHWLKKPRKNHGETVANKPRQATVFRSHKAIATVVSRHRIVAGNRIAMVFGLCTHGLSVAFSWLCGVFLLVDRANFEQSLLNFFDENLFTREDYYNESPPPFTSLLSKSLKFPVKNQGGSLASDRLIKLFQTVFISF